LLSTIPKAGPAFAPGRLFLSEDRRLNLVWRLALYMFSWWVVLVLAAIPAAVLALVLHLPDGVKNALAGVCAVPVLVAWTHF
jgi:hypothetical protein